LAPLEDLGRFLEGEYVARLGLTLPLVSAESVALIPQCAECGKLWLPADGDRWEAYLTDAEPPEIAFYCSECAEREFGN
jgi:hypothetical protein